MNDINKSLLDIESVKDEIIIIAMMIIKKYSLFQSGWIS